MPRNQGWNDDKHYGMGLDGIAGLIKFILKVWIASLILLIPMALLFEYVGPIALITPFLAVIYYDHHIKPRNYWLVRRPEMSRTKRVCLLGLGALIWYYSRM